MCLCKLDFLFVTNIVGLHYLALFSPNWFHPFNRSFFYSFFSICQYFQLLNEWRYVYVCVSAYACSSLYGCISGRVLLHACMCVCVCVCVCVCSCAYVCRVFVSMWVRRKPMCMGIRVCGLRSCLPSCICACLCICVFVRACVHACGCVACVLVLVFVCAPVCVRACLPFAYSCAYASGAVLTRMLRACVRAWVCMCTFAWMCMHERAVVRGLWSTFSYSSWANASLALFWVRVVDSKRMKRNSLVKLEDQIEINVSMTHKSTKS